MALSGESQSVAGTNNVLFREVHKNAWLKRLPVSDKKNGQLSKKDIQKGERLWTVFCVHDDIEPFLELYNDKKMAAAHKPDWSSSLSTTLHISPTICPQDDEFEFVITLQDNIVRLAASSWEVMKDWVDSIGAKLREMHILSPKENVYSRMPELRTPLLPTRDPNSPLPLPPAGPSAVVPGVEPIPSESLEVSDEPIVDRPSMDTSNYHTNDIPVTSSSMVIQENEIAPVIYASSSRARSSTHSTEQTMNQQNITVIQVKPDPFVLNALSDTLTNGTGDNVENFNDETSEDEDCDDIFSDSLTVTPILPRIPNHLPRNNVSLNQTTSHNENVTIVTTEPTKLKRHHSTGNQPSNIRKYENHNADHRSDNNRNRSVSNNESNSNITENVSLVSLSDNGQNDVNTNGSGSSSSSSGSNINLYEHVFLTNQPRVTQTSPVPPALDTPNNSQFIQIVQDNTPPPAPVVSSGSRRCGLRPTRRRSSDSSVNTSGAPVAADRIRHLQPPPNPFRQNSPLTTGDNVTTRLTLREQQVLQLRREMTHPGGVRLQLRRKDCLNSIALVDAINGVWIAGWKQKDHPMLYNALHIGDQIISVAGVRVLNSVDAQKLIRGAPSLYVAFVIRRVPFGRVFALKRESEGQALGLVQEGGTAEIRDVISGSLASSHGLTPRTKTCDGLSLTTWTLTEINGRPLNLFFKENEVKDRLNAVGLDISLLIQPTDLIKQIKKQLKSLKSYKDYIVQ